MDEREEVRRRVDLVELVSEYVRLKKAGRNWSGLCPFHGEKTPSFMVSPDLAIFKCFGCGKGGDCFTFLMEMEGLGFGEALKVLAKRVGVKLRRWGFQGEGAEREKLLEINRLAALWFRYLLTRHLMGQRGREYLWGRGVTNEAVEVFGLGWAPESWDGLFRYLVGKKGFAAKEVERAGLVIAGRGGRYYDRFRGRVMFPLKNYRGEVVGFAGRVLPSLSKVGVADRRRGEKESAKYINTPETRLYHKSELLYGLEVAREEIRKKGRVVVVEGELDMISSWQAGVREVVAIKGSALTEMQVRRLSRLAERLLLALDMDAAGDRAARRGWRVAEAAGMEVRVVRILEGKDPDEMARADAERWKGAVDGAVEVYEFLLESALSRYDVGSAFGKRKVGEELLPVWAEIEDEVVKAHWVKRLAGELGVEERSVWVQLENQKIKIKNQKLGHGRLEGPSSLGLSGGRKGGGSKGRNAREEWERYVWSLVLQFEPKKVLEKDFFKLFESSWAKKLVRLMRDYLEKEKEFEMGKFQGVVPEELREVVGELWMRELGDWEDERARRREIEQIVGRLMNLGLREEMAAVKGKLKKAEEGGDEGEARKLRKKFGELSRRLRGAGVGV